VLVFVAVSKRVRRFSVNRTLDAPRLFAALTVDSLSRFVPGSKLSRRRLASSVARTLHAPTSGVPVVGLLAQVEPRAAQEFTELSVN
jgi:hypothetical protein